MTHSILPEYRWRASPDACLNLEYKKARVRRRALSWGFKPGAMAEVVKYADGVGPGWYMLVDKEKSKPGNIVYTPLVKELAQYKVELHPYTVRKDALPEFFTDVNQMYDALLNKSGATGVFTDFPDTGVELLKKQK